MNEIYINGLRYSLALVVFFTGLYLFSYVVIFKVLGFYLADFLLGIAFALICCCLGVFIMPVKR